MAMKISATLCLIVAVVALYLLWEDSQRPSRAEPETAQKKNDPVFDAVNLPISSSHTRSLPRPIVSIEVNAAQQTQWRHGIGNSEASALEALQIGEFKKLAELGEKLPVGLGAWIAVEGRLSEYCGTKVQTLRAGGQHAETIELQDLPGDYVELELVGLADLESIALLDEFGTELTSIKLGPNLLLIEYVPEFGVFIDGVETRVSLQACHKSVLDLRNRATLTLEVDEQKIRGQLLAVLTNDETLPVARNFIAGSPATWSYLAPGTYSISLYYSNYEGDVPFNTTSALEHILLSHSQQKTVRLDLPKFYDVWVTVHGGLEGEKVVLYSQSQDIRIAVELNAQESVELFNLKAGSYQLTFSGKAGVARIEVQLPTASEINLRPHSKSALFVKKVHGDSTPLLRGDFIIAINEAHEYQASSIQSEITDLLWKGVKKVNLIVLRDGERLTLSVSISDCVRFVEFEPRSVDY